MQKKGICPLTVKLLLNMYIELKLQAKWNDILIDKFNVTNQIIKSNQFYFSTTYNVQYKGNMNIRNKKHILKNGWSPDC